MSASSGIIEHVFEVSELPATFDVVSGDDVELVAAIGAGVRFESAALARQMVAMVDLYDRRRDAQRAALTPQDFRGDEAADLPELWVVDCCASVATEIAAARRISKGRAHSLLSNALALQTRFRRLMGEFLQGRVTYRVVQTVIARTELLDDIDVQLVDDEVVKVASGLDRLSEKKLAGLIDFWVLEIDHLAVRAKRDVHAERFVAFDVREDGMTDITGTLNTADAALLNARLQQVADTVCPQDPRDKTERCADAAGALAAGLSRLECQCGRPQCPTLGADPQEPSAQIVVEVIADRSTLAGGSKPGVVARFRSAAC